MLLNSVFIGSRVSWVSIMVLIGGIGILLGSVFLS